VLGLTRAGIWVLLVLAAANGVFLHFLPGLADTEYAWAIKPPVNAAFIGAGFLAATVATALVLATVTRWRTFSTLPPALWVLASTLLAATIIHADRFRWDYPPTWVWALVYAGVPLAVPFLVFVLRRGGLPHRRRARRPGARPRGVVTQRSGCPMPSRLPSLSRNQAARSPLPPWLG
jgi:hypothetical protein